MIAAPSDTDNNIKPAPRTTTIRASLETVAAEMFSAQQPYPLCIYEPAAETSTCHTLRRI